MNAHSPQRLSLSVIVPLGITQTIGYGTVYYAYAVLAGPISADTGLSLSTIYGCFSLGLLAGACVALFAGRLLDRFHPASVMSAGSLATALLLGLWAIVPGIVAFATFAVLVQAVSVLIFYEAAFVAAARLEPANARRTITGITLIAGFSSTIFWPMTAWLIEHMGWREVYLVYAAMNLIVCAPLHLYLVRGAERGRIGQVNPLAETSASDRGQLSPGRTRRLVYVLMQVAFAANAYVIGAVHLHLIGILGALGLGFAAASVGALIGPAQVAGRVIEFVGGGRFSIVSVSIVAAGLLPVALLILLFGAPGLAAAIAFAVLFGVGQGLSYIVRGVLPLAMFGATGYGALTGKFNLVRLLISAGAPFLTAVIIERGGTTAALASIVVAATIGVAALVGIAIRAGRT
ncbi:MAG: MFS transporter [Rhizobiaceae bacterium]|nr:MFS transporter [Rhizobiaceae bacterium]